MSRIACLVLLCSSCATLGTAPVEHNKALIEAFVHATNARDFDRLGELVHADLVRHCQATPELVISDREAFLDFQRQDLATFPDAVIEIQTIVAEHDLVAVWGSYRGTQEGPMGPFPASGRSMTLEFGTVFRIEGNRIAEIWVTWDNLAALTQLGHFPPPTTTSPRPPTSTEHVQPSP
ncbi:MAG: ester cyclase [Planctomycetes bacterium]|nr:ester cyclase [Planctomycetota bacterium]